jgi:hypothetical protein
MAPDTGIIYRDVQISVAQQNGVKLIPVTNWFAAQFRSGSTEAQKAVSALQQIKTEKPWLSQMVAEQRALKMSRGQK